MSTVGDTIRQFSHDALKALEDDVEGILRLKCNYDPKRWMEFTWYYFNAAYPSTADPNELLVTQGIKLPQSWVLVECVPERYVTWGFSVLEHPENAICFAYDYAQLVLRIASPDSALEAEYDQK